MTARLNQQTANAPVELTSAAVPRLCLYTTFTISVELMLNARGKKLKTSDVPRSLTQLYPPPKDYNPLLEDLQATDRIDLYNTRDYRIN